MAKGDAFYFENFSQTARILKSAAQYLTECLKNYDSEKIEEMLQKMHELEHSADKKRHEMSAALIKAFVTPVDREDLDLISQQLDEVADKIEEVMQKFFVYDIKTIRPDAIAFSEKLVSSCDLILKVTDEFHSFKKSKKIRELIIEINSAEEECDRLFLESMRKLTKESTDVLEIISWRKIYECLEACADSCEHVSDCIGLVIMKNS